MTTRCTFKSRNGTKLPPIGKKWRGVGPLSRESWRLGPAGVGKVAAERIVEEPALEKSGVDREGFMASIARNVLKATRRLGFGTGTA